MSYHVALIKNKLMVMVKVFHEAGARWLDGLCVGHWIELSGVRIPLACDLDQDTLHPHILLVNMQEAMILSRHD